MSLRKGLTAMFCAVAGLVATGCEPEAAPAPEDTDGLRVFGQADEDTRVALRVGDRFGIRLESIPTAGYMWMPFVTPACVTQAKDDTQVEPTNPDLQNQPGFTGGNHYVTLQFEAVSACTDDLEIVEAREWELYNDDGSIKDESAITDRYRLRMTVTP